jgi:hypothetical protein
MKFYNRKYLGEHQIRAHGRIIKSDKCETVTTTSFKLEHKKIKHREGKKEIFEGIKLEVVESGNEVNQENDAQNENDLKVPVKIEKLERNEISTTDYKNNFNEALSPPSETYFEKKEDQETFGDENLQQTSNIENGEENHIIEIIHPEKTVEHQIEKLSASISSDEINQQFQQIENEKENLTESKNCESENRKENDELKNVEDENHESSEAELGCIVCFKYYRTQEELLWHQIEENQ